MRPSASGAAQPTTRIPARRATTGSNNKGGTGKTSLCFQSICFYADEHPDERVLALDLCPQANLSELLLGGLTNNGSTNLLARQGEIPRATIGGYFQERLPSPYSAPVVTHGDFITRPRDYNPTIPENVDLVCGDPLLELQSNAISTLAEYANSRHRRVDQCDRLAPRLPRADRRRLRHDLRGRESELLDLHPEGATRTLDAHACRLRRKLEQVGAAGHIVNRRGVGYRLVDRASELSGESGQGARGDGAVVALRRVSDAS